MKKEKFKNKILVFLSILFIIGLWSYFKFRNTTIWVADIIPEFLGSILLGFLIIFALKKRTKFIVYSSVLTIVIIIGVIAYMYGVMNNIQFLTDLGPELLGSTGISLVLSLIFKRKIWQ